MGTFLINSVAIVFVAISVIFAHHEINDLQQQVRVLDQKLRIVSLDAMTGRATADMVSTALRGKPNSVEMKFKDGIYYCREIDQEQETK